MKKWIKTIALALAILNILLILSSVIPLPTTPYQTKLAFAGKTPAISAEQNSTEAKCKWWNIFCHVKNALCWLCKETGWCNCPTPS